MSFPSGTNMQFEGVISLDGGGFSSVRSTIKNLDLSSYAGVSIRFQTLPPGSVPLGLHLQFSDSTQRYSFASAFAIPPGKDGGEESTVFLPSECSLTMNP